MAQAVTIFPYIATIPYALAAAPSRTILEEGEERRSGQEMRSTIRRLASELPSM